MPIPDAQAGPPEKPPDLVEVLAPQVIELANKAMRHEISAREWEAEIKKLLKEKD